MQYSDVAPWQREEIFSSSGGKEERRVNPNLLSQGKWTESLEAGKGGNANKLLSEREHLKGSS